MGRWRGEEVREEEVQEEEGGVAEFCSVLEVSGKNKNPTLRMWGFTVADAYWRRRLAPAELRARAREVLEK